jgi:hypothetical protein
MKMDVEKAVAAYTRSDAGAGHGESAILPSDLRTPMTLSVCPAEVETMLVGS